jgi:hypothetical protein
VAASLEKFPGVKHDDVFWSVALAVYAAVDLEPEPFSASIPERKWFCAPQLFNIYSLPKLPMLC